MLFEARLICSESACPAAFEARAPTLRELEALACDCGCALQVLGWPDTVEATSPAGLEIVLLAA